MAGHAKQAMTSGATPQRPRASPSIVAALALTGGLVVSGIAFVQVRTWESERITAHFQHDTASMAANLRTEIRSHLETLHFLREFYARTPQVTRHEFAAFVQGAIDRHCGYQSLKWVPRVPAQRREAFEAAVRAEGFPDFRIHPVTQRAEHFPVDFVVPRAPNGWAHGFDLASDPVRLEALEQARDSGEMQATAPIRPVQRADEQAGFQVCMPIYQSDQPQATAEQRRQHLSGFVVGVFRVGDLIENAFTGLEMAGIRYCVEDVTEPDRSTVVYRCPFAVESSAAAAVAGAPTEVCQPGALRFQEVLEVAGRRWLLECHPVAGHAAFRGSWLPHGALAVGVLFSVLLAGYLASLVGRSARISRLIGQRTAEVSEANALLTREVRERRRAEKVLERSSARQVRLNRLLQDELPRLHTLDDKLRKITETVVELLGADFCRIWVIVPGDRCDAGCIHATVTEGPHACRQRNRCLHLLASSGRYTHTDGEVHRRVPFGCYDIGKVAAGQDARFLTNDVQHDPRVHDHAWARELGLVAFAGYRLCATDGTPIGVLALFRQRAIPPDEDSLLEGIAASASHAIQTTRAESELRRVRDELEIRVQQRTADLAESNRALAAEIADRTRAEHSLRESETKYRQLFEGLNDAVFLADAETGRILETNRRGEELLGRPRHEIVGMHQRELHPPEQAAEYEAMFAAHMVQGRAVDYESAIAGADGTVLPVRVSAARLNLHGRPALLGLFRDIADQKRADKAALTFARQQSVIDALLRSGLEDAPLDDILEHCLDEVLFNSWMDLAPHGAIYVVEGEPAALVLRARASAGDAAPAWCARVSLGECLCGRAAATGQTTYSDGTEAAGTIACAGVPARGRYCVPLRSPHGPLGVLLVETQAGHARSVIEEDCLDAAAATIAETIHRKRMEERLRESEARHRTITEAAQDGIITADASGRIRFWNPAAEKIFGFKAGEIVGQSMTELIVPPRLREAKQRGLAEFARTGGGPAVGQTLELSGLRKDGTEFPIQISISGYRDHQGYVAVALVKDITDRKRAQAELEAANRELRDAARRAGMAEVASGVLHNVGNVLNTANVSAQLALDHVRQLEVARLAQVAPLLEAQTEQPDAEPGDNGKTRQIAAYLRQLAEHLAGEQASVLQELNALQESIRHVGDIVSTQQAYARDIGVIESFSAESVIKDSLRMSTTSFGQLGIEVILECDPGLRLTADRQKLLQVLVNLIRNAKHALQERDADRQLTVTAAPIDGERVRISVMDNGAGIAPEHRSRMFSFGFTTKRDGHGFGLHSSALAVKEMRGTLTVHSAGPGQGATFTLELPESLERTNDVKHDCP